MSDSLAEMPSQPGLILKSAREEMSLSLEQVAHELHLRPAVVRAIEEENYDEFSSDVFLKGYFRTYCRLVNLHETRMMDVLEKQLLARNKKAEQAEQLAHKKIQARKRKRLFITITVFCVCIFLIAFTYQMTNQGFGVSDNLNTNGQNEPVADLDLSSTVPETTIPELSDPANNLPQADVPIEIETKPVLTEGQPAQTIVSESDELPDEEIDLNSLDELNQSEPADISADEITALTSIKALFTGDCWFKVTDVTGKNVIAALKKSNEEVNYQGSAPFHVVIGDASKVSLFFEEKLVNLKPYTSRNGRAELTLKPSDSINQG